MKKQAKKVRAIIYDIKTGKPYFLILHRVLHWQGWEFLKETIESGESPRDALKRGIKEEIGFENFAIIKSLNKQEKWQASEKDYIIVDAFLVKADMDEKISLKQKIVEHDEYQWTDKETAIKKLTWPESKKLLKNLNLHGKN
jgi:ADP-ribose pyrophosphatase YjhB (NUDIX family)